MDVVVGVGFRVDFVRLRFDIGSKEMTRVFGSGMGAISIVSMNWTFVSHDDVGDMAVGRVSVAVSKYETVPRSNYMRQISKETQAGRSLCHLRRCCLVNLLRETRARS